MLRYERLCRLMPERRRQILMPLRQKAADDASFDIIATIRDMSYVNNQHLPIIYRA